MQRISLALPVMARVSNLIGFMRDTPADERHLVTKLALAGDFKITSLKADGGFTTNVQGTGTHYCIGLRPEEVKYLTLWSAAC